MDLIIDIFNYHFFANAILASISIGIICGIIGTYVVSKRVVALSGAITHASFGGIGIAHFLGLNPFAGAMLFAISSSIAIQHWVNRGIVREDAAIGVLWSLGMTVGVIFISITPGYTPNLMSYLFGNILSVSKELLISSGIMALVLIVIIAFMHRPIVYATFDSNYSKTQNIPTQKINLIMMIFVAITIVLTLKLVGIVLLISLVTIPPISAALLTSRYLTMTIYSSIIAVIGMTTGVIVSYYTNLPPGAAIVTSLSLIYIIIKGVKMMVLRSAK